MTQTTPFLSKKILSCISCCLVILLFAFGCTTPGQIQKAKTPQIEASQRQSATDTQKRPVAQAPPTSKESALEETEEPPSEDKQESSSTPLTKAETQKAIETGTAEQNKKQTLQSPVKPQAEEQSPTETNNKQKIALDFDNADIYEVINALSDILNINYIIDPAVRGKVNIHTSGEIDKSQLFPILETIFELNNIAAVKVGNLYKIVPVKEARSRIVDLGIGKKIEAIPSPDRVIIQIVPLRYIPVSEIIKVLKPFVRRGGDLLAYSKGNILLIVDTASNVRKLLNLIDVLDVDAFEHTTIRFFKINNADVKDVSKDLEEIFSSLGVAKSTEKGLGIAFIPVERINYIIAVSSIPDVFEKVQQWLDILDAVDVAAEEQVFIYFLENGKASEIADVLTKIYGEGVAEQKTSSRTIRRTTLKTRAKATLKKSEGISAIKGKIKIVTDESTNSIIIRATPQDYAIIKKTIKKLDIIPKQVLIEVLIAEVTLSGDTEFGIEWALKGNRASLGGYKGEDEAKVSFGLAGQDLSGFTYFFNSDRLQAFLVAQASHNNLNVLASPQILAADNKEAKIEVGDEVPIVTSEYVPLQAEQVETTSRNIEYRSTGIILTVTPRINDKGLVAMDIYQEVSEALQTVSSGIQSPTISNRKAQTSLVVQNGQTIVIGGIIKERSSKTISGVPFLSNLPILGYLFSDTKQSKKKTELLILITPHVITNFEEADMVTREIKGKLEQIQKQIIKNEQRWVDPYR